jgi:hypothetical protein
MLVNNSDSGLKVRVRTASAAPATKLASYHYFDADRPADDRGFPKMKEALPDADLQRGVEVPMPSRGVVFLTTIQDY